MNPRNRWPTKRRSLAARFWEKVSKPSATSGCWLWLGSVDVGGYGRFQLASRRTVKASRVSWMLTRGPIPSGVCVLHHCDNPLCVNPDHLFLGTNADNSHDRDQKGRTAVGERNGKSVLTAAQVLEIRKTYLPHKIGCLRITRLLGLPFGAVHNVLHGGTWKQVVLEKTK
jgi:hypothetical protein